jgi:hypothetical protein
LCPGLRGVGMDYIKVWALVKRSSKVLLGVAIGASVTCVSARVPILVEVNLGTEESHIKFDSRNGELCEVTEKVTQ